MLKCTLLLCLVDDEILDSFDESLYGPHFFGAVNFPLGHFLINGNNKPACLYNLWLACSFYPLSLLESFLVW